MRKKILPRVSIAFMTIVLLISFSLVATATPGQITADDVVAKINVDYTVELTDTIANLWPSGFAIAGSQASEEQGNFLVNEMKKIGIKKVVKDYFPVDAWDYSSLTFKVNSPEIRFLSIAPFAGSIGTNGKDLTADIVYVGYGSESELAKAGVNGKVVLAEFDLLYDYWPSMVAEQAAKMGAKALVIMYSSTNTTDPDALNSFDTQSLLQIPIVNISKTDGNYLKELLSKDTVNVTLNSDAEVTKDKKSYNILGYIPGKHPDKYIIIGAHRDAFFKPFSDDTLGCASVISIAKAFKEAGYRPEHTLLFVNYCGEEYGVSERRYDWLQGSWNLFSANHPELQENTIVVFNIDNYLSNNLSTVYRMRGPNSLLPYMENFVDQNGVPSKWSDGVSFLSPNSTFFDSYVPTIFGIPSIDMNKTPYASNQYMTYHTNIDTKQRYFGTEQDAAASRETIQYTLSNYIRMIIEFDHIAITPLNFSAEINAFKATLDSDSLAAFGIDTTDVINKADALASAGQTYAAKVDQINAIILAHPEKAKIVQSALAAENNKVYAIFQDLQDKFYKLDVWDTVIFAHEKPTGNLIHLQKTVDALNARDFDAAVNALSGVDVTWYAGMFDEEVFDHWNLDILDSSKYDIYWAEGKVINELDDYDLYNNLLQNTENTSSVVIQSQIDQLEFLISQQTGLIKVFFADQSTLMNNDLNKLDTSGLDSILAKLQ